MPDDVFACTDLSYRYPGTDAPALAGLDLSVGEGRMTAVLGPNGAGKSTLVRLLAGTLRPTAGEARFLGRPVAEWGRTELARRLAVVTQEAPPGVPQTVREYVSLGRNPYVSPWSALSGRDAAIVEEALCRVGLEELAGRALDALSGGERQRARIARALAQEPDVLILDEPTAHLDIGHGLWAFETIAGLVRRGITAVCVTHDMNLASRYADDLVLIANGRALGRGAPTDVLTEAALASAYGCEVRVEDRASLGLVVLPAASAGRA